MKDFWDDLLSKNKNNNLNVDEEDLFKRLTKSIKFLSIDPKHPSLQTHEIEELSKKYKMKIWQSYLDHKKRLAGFFGHTGQIEKR